MVETNFSILRKKIRRLVDEFELKYKDILPSFSGSLNEFKDAKELIEEIFSYKELIDRSIFM